MIFERAEIVWQCSCWCWSMIMIPQKNHLTSAAGHTITITDRDRPNFLKSRHPSVIGEISISMLKGAFFSSIEDGRKLCWEIESNHMWNLRCTKKQNMWTFCCCCWTCSFFEFIYIENVTIWNLVSRDNFGIEKWKNSLPCWNDLDSTLFVPSTCHSIILCQVRVSEMWLNLRWLVSASLTKLWWSAENELQGFLDLCWNWWWCWDVWALGDETLVIISDICDLDEFSLGRCVRVWTLSNDCVVLIGWIGFLQCSSFFGFDSIFGFVSE